MTIVIKPHEERLLNMVDENAHHRVFIAVFITLDESFDFPFVIELTQTFDRAFAAGVHTDVDPQTRRIIGHRDHQLDAGQRDFWVVAVAANQDGKFVLFHVYALSYWELSTETLVLADGTDDIRRGDQVHALGDGDTIGFNRLEAEVIVGFGTIIEFGDPGLPATSMGTAGQASNRVQVLMSWIGFPGWRLTAASNDDAGLPASQSRLGRDSGSEVHGEADGGDDPLGVVDQPDVITATTIGQIDDIIARQLGVVVLRQAGLHEVDLVLEMIDDFLHAPRVPPLDGGVRLAAIHHDPVGSVAGGLLFDRRPAHHLVRGHVQVAVEGTLLDLDAKDFGEVLAETVDEVVRPLIALVDQRIVGIYPLHIGIFPVKSGQVGVVFPQVWAWGVDASQEHAWIALVQVSDGCGQHQQVARGLAVVDDDFPGHEGIYLPEVACRHRFLDWHQDGTVAEVAG